MRYLQSGDADVTGPYLHDMAFVAAVYYRPIDALKRQRFADDETLTISRSADNPDGVVRPRVFERRIDGRERQSLPYFEHARAALSGEEKGQQKETQ
ncbi:hypothetical protein LPYR103PRE_07640 [Segatella asaccharophila]